jgi:hypothetical protein
MGHQLRITAIDAGWTGWALDCLHDGDSMFHRDHTGRLQAECWLQGWWSELGAELLNIEAPEGGTLTFPLAVTPSGDWDFDGGTLVLDQ